MKWNMVKRRTKRIQNLAALKQQRKKERKKERKGEWMPNCKWHRNQQNYVLCRLYSHYWLELPVQSEAVVAAENALPKIDIHWFSWFLGRLFAIIRSPIKDGGRIGRNPGGRWQASWRPELEEAKQLELERTLLFLWIKMRHQRFFSLQLYVSRLSVYLNFEIEA